jgi:hypothetical protein
MPPTLVDGGCRCPAVFPSQSLHTEVASRRIKNLKVKMNHDTMVCPMSARPQAQAERVKEGSSQPDRKHWGQLPKCCVPNKGSRGFYWGSSCILVQERLITPVEAAHP